MEPSRYWLLEQILLPGPRIPDPSLLRTHPPTEERVRRLVELAERQPERGQLVIAQEDLRHLIAEQPFRARWHRNGMWY